MLDMSKYEKMSAEKCWKDFGWGSEAKPASIVYHRCLGEYEIFVDEMVADYSVNGEDVFGCELYREGDMAGQWFDSSVEQAIRGAVVDSVGSSVMRDERNCEDAVNGIAYESYQVIFGKTPMADMNIGQIDALLGLARSYVKANAKWHGFEWEEF